MIKKQHIIIGILCFLMTMGISIQVKTVNSWETDTTVQSSTKENKLKDSVLKQIEQYNNTKNERDKIMATLDETRKKIADSNEEASEIEKQIDEINKLLGYTEVKGKGIVITLDDGSNKTGDANDFIVHDGDLLEVTNELFNAGAQAVSINGQRIVSTTAITCSGNIIRVNNEKIGVPFVINAIGLPEKLSGALDRPEGYLEWMRNDGVKVSIEKSDDITVPKYEGIYNNQYMKSVE